MSNYSRRFFSPGRVNLIGEHIDYNRGLVLPLALDLGITATYTPRADSLFTLGSVHHAYVHVGDLNAIPSSFQPAHDWANYPLGIMDTLAKQGIPLDGFDIIFDSTLPESSGLSSSGSIEVLMAFTLLAMAGAAINLQAIAILCQKVENDFIGVKCGIMDQFVIANAVTNHAMLLDCATLDYEQLPFELDDYRLLVINSKVPRSLIHSAYNQRKAECELALKELIRHDKLSDNQFLVDAEIEDLVAISDPVLYRRARHVLSENMRVKQATQFLKMGDLHTLGRLMVASHQSLQLDYEVTGKEMDALVETAISIEGCLGARITGAGFGGCAIALVRDDKVNKFTDDFSREYTAITGLYSEIYPTSAGAGVREL